MVCVGWGAECNLSKDAAAFEACTRRAQPGLWSSSAGKRCARLGAACGHVDEGAGGDQCGGAAHLVFQKPDTAGGWVRSTDLVSIGLLPH